MHTRYARAAVDAVDAVATVTEHSNGHRTQRPDRYRRSNSPPTVLWATRPLAMGRDCAVAVMLRDEQLLVRVVAANTGLGRWVPAERALTSAQVERWLELAKFYRG